MASRRYLVGTSGWVYRHWQRVFYPADLRQPRWFGYYADRFCTVEINNTFYRLPSEKAWEAWRDAAPPGFVYAVKGSRFVTHVKRLKDTDAVENFTERARSLAGALGPILWQLPPNMKRDDDRLVDFLSALPRDVRHVMEFRNDTWLQPEVFALLRMHNVGFCAYHMVDRETPLEATTDFAYMRFHGSGRMYGGTYSKEELRSWGRRLRDLPEDVREVFAYFNNDAFGFAVENARDLKEMLGAEQA